MTKMYKSILTYISNVLQVITQLTYNLYFFISNMTHGLIIFCTPYQVRIH